MNTVAAFIIGTALVASVYLNIIFLIMLYFRNKRLKLKDERIEWLNGRVNSYQDLYHKYYMKYADLLIQETKNNKKTVERLRTMLGGEE